MNEMIDTKLPTCYYLSPKPNTGFALGGFPKLTDGKNKAQEQTSGLVRMEDINIVKLFIYFVSVCIKLQEWTQTDTRVTFHHQHHKTF